MEKHIHSMMEEMANTYQLTDYFLGRHELIRTKNYLHETNYALVMEWFPNFYQDWADKTENPPGTVILEIDFHSKRLRSLTYTEPIKQPSFLPPEKIEAMANWIRRQTGLVVGKQLHLVKQADHIYEFRAVKNHVPIYPIASVRFQFVDSYFQSFSINGVFPPEEKFKLEDFHLHPDTIQPVIESQCKKMIAPNFADTSWQAIYGIEEIFITNDGMNLLPLDFHYHEASFVELNHQIQWKSAISTKHPSKKRPIFIEDKVSLEMALKKETHPDFKQISDWDILASMDCTEVFLQKYYPNDSGKWIFKKIYRQLDFLVVSLVRENAFDLFNQKLHLYIDAKTKELVNYLDSQFIYGDFKKALYTEEDVITVSQALRKLYKYIRFTPVYVYDFIQKKYILCGKLNCPYGIDVITGKKIRL